MTHREKYSYDCVWNTYPYRVEEELKRGCDSISWLFLILEAIENVWYEA